MMELGAKVRKAGIKAPKGAPVWGGRVDMAGDPSYLSGETPGAWWRRGSDSLRGVLPADCPR